MSMGRHTKPYLEDVKRAIEEGKKPSEIKSLFPASYSYISMTKRRMGILPLPAGRKPGCTERIRGMKEEIMSLVKSGKSRRQIGLVFGITKQRVQQILNPLKHSARMRVQRAIKAGKLVKPKYCSNCGNKSTLQAHHDDYLRPLDVVFLCRDCHFSKHHPERHF